MNNFKEHREILRIIFTAYRDKLISFDIEPTNTEDFSPGNAHWMCDTALTNLYSFPVDKLNRWLGFVQGCLISWKMTTVNEQREWTRPFFKEHYIRDN
jgi:hypothetical protein